MIQNQDQLSYSKAKFKVVYLSISFLILFTAYSSTQNIIGVLFKEQGYEQLGFTSLIFLYFSFAISTLFVNRIIKKYSYKTIFSLSSIGYTLLNISGIWVTMCKQEEKTGICSNQLIYSITFIFSAFCGMSASTIWVAQGVYIDQLSSQIPQHKGSLYGLFWSIFLVNNIISCIMSAVIINFRKPLDYFIVTSSLGIIATIFFTFIPQPTNKQDQNDQFSNLRCEKDLSKKEQLYKIYKLIISKETRSLMIFTCFSGVIMSFCSGFLSELVEDSIGVEQIKKDLESQKLSLVCICLGFFEVLSGIVSHKLGDKISPNKLALFSSLVSLIAIMLSFVGLISHNFFFCFLIGATWGFSDGLFENLMSIIASKRFGGSVYIFQAIIFIQNIGFCFSQLLFTMLESQPIYVYPMIVNIIALITNVSLQFDEKNDYQQNYVKLDQEYSLLPEKYDISEKDTEDSEGLGNLITPDFMESKF
ncbi:hypothetical protein ABPG72_019615 [Tetrahymena utriculariae]